ncbi:MAG: lactonase family protein [Candidatus Poribacteria bacterium]|nr:lactonase family protein [Candidatus Poribacteria bacterium]
MQSHLYLSIAGENRIAIYTFDVSDGAIEFQEDVNVSGSPGPLTLSPCGNYLYAGLRSSREISTFRIDEKSKQLTLLKTISLDADTCYIATDKTGKYLLSAYYGAGKVTVHAIGDDKTAQDELIQTVETAPHAHYIETDVSNRFAFVPHTVPANAIYQFHFDPDTGILTENPFGNSNPDEPVGPRHYCEHPNKPIFYFSNEQGSSVSAYNLQKGDPEASISKSGDPDYTVHDAPGLLWEFQTLSTLPADFDEHNSCAQIHIDPQGKFLYVTNRGHDSIAMFSIDEESGELTALGQQLTEPTPRVFNIDETGNFLFAGGQGSGKLATYRIDRENGVLAPLETYEVGENPMWVLFV